MTLRYTLWLVLLLAPQTLLSAIDGVVTSAEGIPVEHVRIESEGGTEVAFSDMNGEFFLEESEPPLNLIATHPRFEPAVVYFEGGGQGIAHIELVAKQQIYEEIAVSANRGETNFSPVSVATSVIEPSESLTPPATLTQMVSDVPAVSENGQGGMFQTYSIRGVSRQRVMTLVSGMRIVGERRAGVSASFVDPTLMGTVDILRGPSSTYYGSGALGGVVQIFPRQYEGLAVDTGYANQGNESFLSVGWGGGGWSVGGARRVASQSETPTGDVIFSGFEQTSGTLQKSWSGEKFEHSLVVIASAGRDIEKPNTDFPERTTVYPEENHLLLRYALKAASNWSLEAWVHPNSLDTRVVDEGDQQSDLQNSASNLGLNWIKRLDLGEKTSARLGVDYFGRRGVEATETTQPLGPRLGPVLIQKTLDEASEDEAGAYGALEWNVGKAVVLAGGRFAWQQQQNADEDSVGNSAVTGFAGVVMPLGAGFELAANLGSGLRFPSLSERFFSGVTGRGLVEGNPDLDSERSLNLDTGLRWYGDRLFVAGYLFRNEIADYIERIEFEEGKLTFVNLTSGTIQGLEIEGLFQVGGGWSMTFGGHLMEGRSDRDEPLADIPSNRLYLGGRWASGPWAVEARWEERSEKTDPGSGEKPIPTASLLSASASYEFTRGLALTLSGGNLLDEQYFNSADRKVTLSPGRRVALSFRWRQK